MKQLLAGLNLPLAYARWTALAAAVGAGITAFTSAVTTNGGYKAGIVAALAAVVGVWMHEEHSTERNATTAAASLKAAQPATVPAELQELLSALEHSGEGLLGALTHRPAPASSTPAQSPPGSATPASLAHSAQPAPTQPS